MTRSVILAALVMTIAFPASAGAWDFWTWLSDFSGPGPFSGTFFALTGTVCRQGDRWKPSPIAKDSEAHEEVIVCIYFDRESFHDDADPSRGYPDLRIRANDIGASLRVRDWLDVGAGMGWLSITDTTSDTTRSRFVMSPVRVVVRPLLLFLPEKGRHRSFGILSFYWKDIYVPGVIRGRDFGQKPPSDLNEFRASHDVVHAYGLTLDLTALTGLIRH